jgi:sarcosine oxidase subunit beta
VKRLTVGFAMAASHAEGIPDAAGDGGATFVTRAGAHGIRVRDGRVVGVDTSRGSIDAPAVVIAAGPFTALVAALAGVSIELRPTRRQKLVIPDLAAIPVDAPMTIEEETAVHWRPAMRGCLALFTDPDTPPSEPHDPVPVDHDWAFGLLDPGSDHGLARVAPFWADAWAGGGSTLHWFLQAGQYEVTPDRRPYLGPIGPTGLHLNGGYSGHGIMAGPGGSRQVVDLITGAADPDANQLRPDRQMDAREHDIL